MGTWDKCKVRSETRGGCVSMKAPEQAPQSHHSVILGRGTALLPAGMNTRTSSDHKKVPTQAGLSKPQVGRTGGTTQLLAVSGGRGCGYFDICQLRCPELLAIP